MIRSLRIALAAFFLLNPLAILAQEKSAPPQPVNNEVEALRKKLEAQAAQLDQLQKDLQRQSQLIGEQQHQLQSLKGGAQPAAAPVASTSSAKPVEEKKPAASADNGYGKIKINGLLQGWYSAGNAGSRDTFRIRRTELKFSSEIVKDVKWTLMIDPSKALSLNQTFATVNGEKVVTSASVNHASRILQDAFITLGYSKKANVNIGQFKVPNSLEGLQSSAALDTVERALFITDRARGGALGDVRDIGVMVYGPVTKSVDYQFGMFNGGGENQNDVDKNDQKAVAGRLVVRPSFVKGLQIGGSGSYSGNGSRIDRPRRDRAGAEFLYANNVFKFKSEFMAGSDGDLHRRGFYAHTGYKFMPKVEGVFRFDSFDPDIRLETNAANVTERDYIAGFNYFITENNVKLQANYMRKTFANGIVAPRNLFLVNLQTSW